MIAMQDTTLIQPKVRVLPVHQVNTKTNTINPIARAARQESIRTKIHKSFAKFVSV
jgi:hypothetical protein